MSSATARTPSYSDDDPPDGEARWRLLARLPSQVEAALLEGLLAEHEIQSVVESVFFSQEPTSFGALGEYRLHVLEADYQKAQGLVDEVRLHRSGGAGLELV
ncbi:MAG: DUF2007 domain-containing protein [Acidobacteria bacterium]|nr:MAG: DUF2007 domain-containing protein [Acidobacteriota bacterium]REK10322.1 MAG: DUF2007 domain-containing protein [Acidobacteriota bacterium]